MTTLREELSKPIYEGLTFEEKLEKIQNMDFETIDSYKIKSGKAGAFLSSPEAGFAWSKMRKAQHAYLNNLKVDDNEISDMEFSLIDQTIATVKKDDGFFDMKPNTPVGDSNLQGMKMLNAMGYLPDTEAFLDLGRKQVHPFPNVTLDQVKRAVLIGTDKIPARAISYDNPDNRMVRLSGQRCKINITLDKVAKVDTKVKVDVYNLNMDNQQYEKSPFMDIIIPEGEKSVSREFDSGTGVHFQMHGYTYVDTSFTMLISRS